MYFVYVSFSDNLNNFLDIKFMSKGQVNGSIRNNSILLPDYSTTNFLFLYKWGKNRNQIPRYFLFMRK